MTQLIRTVHIYFAQNTPPGDSDADKVGKFTPSTIPAHIWADQESQQVIVLDDDLDDDDEGVTSGLDAGLYAGIEDEHFFVLTSAQTAAYVLGNKVEFGTTRSIGHVYSQNHWRCRSADDAMTGAATPKTRKSSGSQSRLTTA